MKERKCCDDMCHQGRYCPNRTQYQNRFYNLIQWIKGLFK
jgi:hypothetical protein